MATDWSAVTAGFLVALVVGLLGGIALPALGTLGGGVFGGLVAGYLAGEGLGRGAWHGLLAGAIGGVVIALVFGLVLGFATGPLGPLVGGGAFVIGLLVAFVTAIDSAIAGAIGAWLEGALR